MELIILGSNVSKLPSVYRIMIFSIVLSRLVLGIGVGDDSEGEAVLSFFAGKDPFPFRSQ